MEYDHGKGRKTHRTGKPVTIFAGIIVLAAVVSSAWLYNEYKLRKAVEAANEKNAAYTAGTPERIPTEEMNDRLKTAGMTVDENGNVGLEGLDMDRLINKVRSDGVLTGGGVPDIKCKKAEDGKLIYTVNGQETAERPQLFGEKELFYNGVHYKRNTAVKAWLFLGVDNKGSLQIDRDISEIGLSDGIFLVAENTAKNRVHIIQIPRDTMTVITVTDKNSDPVGTAVDHLTRAWMYGDNHEKSGKYAMDAVSGVLGGLKIDGYMAGSIDIINKLNNYVGGVEVTIEDDDLEAADPAFVKGATVLLKGDQAEKFVRRRDITVDFTAMTRMSRHRQYVMAFDHKITKLAKRDSDVIPGMFSLIEDNIVTNMKKGTYLKIAMDAVLSGEPLSDKDFSNLEGENLVNHEEEKDEFWPDYEQVDQLVLDTFFRQM
ncbi:LCP family protein [[Clostridium] aminophilum]|uniref:Transcriptional attenuator, LytR family n=1 Tax=[Clostridium] aminophilum TaxID=1526 RepID=A0A1I6JKN1_9FIRM|nr:LCP family protein [[Clostridium] aminophilum]SFR79471.1 transcriptional attenuator, LytR family [[Clostridium] aminophilum]